MPRSKANSLQINSSRAPKGRRGDEEVTSVLSEDQARAATRPLATVVKLPYVRPLAFDLLAAQPVSLVGMSQAERDIIVVTAVADGRGNEYPVSRFLDSVWYLASERKAKNRKASHHHIIWPDDVPKALVDDAKAALYCALRRGPNGTPWSGSSVERCGKEAAVLLRHLASIGLNSFSETRALLLSDHIVDLKRTLKPNSIRHRLALIDLVWQFPFEVFHPILEHPWSGDTLSRVSGRSGEEGDAPVGRTGKTPVIPRSAQYAFMEYCEARLDEAEELLLARDAGKIPPFSYQLTPVRDAVLYLTQITSGMRNSESVGVTNGCWRTEVLNGVSFHWVRTEEIKTGKGAVDYLVPPETIKALVILERFAKPLQARLADEARWLRVQLRRGANENGLLGNGMNVAEAVDRANRIREIGTHLFLALDKYHSDHLGNGSRVDVMSVDACNTQLKTLARAAGTDWDLANHQCRRTFAYNVANSRLGRMGLVFLKWQLKHASMSWTQLYASNPYQDTALYRELKDEQIQARVELMEGWMQSDAALSGGAGKKIMQTRATPVRNSKHLLFYTAKEVVILSTGHAWCLSGTEGCHGHGVYEPTMCGGCSHAIIDGDQATTWQMIHLDNLRLAAITDCGPAVVQKSQRSIRRSEAVLKDLGVSLPSAEQAEAYEKEGAIL